MHSPTIPFPVENLFALAVDENVPILWYPLNESPRGRYLFLDGQAVIFLSPALKTDPVALRCTLAHELGHHYTGFREITADRWARHMLLPEDWMLARAYWMSPAEMAEESGVYHLWVYERLKELQGRSTCVSA